MPIEITCPRCRRRIIAHESWSGKAVPCPQCKQIVPVPAGTVPAKPTVPAPSLVSARPKRQQGRGGAWLPLLIISGAGGLLLGLFVLFSIIGRDPDRAASKKSEPPRQSRTPASAAMASQASPRFAEAPAAAAPLLAPVESLPAEAGRRQSATVSAPANSPTDPPLSPLVDRTVGLPVRNDPPTQPSVRRSPPLPPRPYEQGPLGPSDYGIDPPASRQGLAANTYVNIRYRYLARTTPTRRGVKATATSVTVDAEVDSAQSWNLDLGNSRLLAHEQLHFDITHLYAVRWQRVLDTQVAKQRLTAFAKDKDAAAAQLNAAIDRDFQTVKDAMFKFQKQYDEETSRGLDHVRQDQWQERIRQELLDLE